MFMSHVKLSFILNSLYLGMCLRCPYVTQSPTHPLINKINKYRHDFTFFKVSNPIFKTYVTHVRAYIRNVI